MLPIVTALAACRPVGRESHGIRHAVGTFPLRFLSIGPPVSPCLPSPDWLPFRSWLQVVVQSCSHDGFCYRGLPSHLQRAHAGRTQPAGATARARASAKRVCRAWGTASGVQVPRPGIREAEGKEKGQLRHREVGGSPTQKVGGDEQKPNTRSGTPGASGHVTAKPSIREWGVLYRSGVYARKVVPLALGGLYGVRLDRGLSDSL